MSVKKKVLLIPAAGAGVRIRALRKKLPKPLLLFRGRPLLDYHLSLAERLKFDRVVIVTGYQRRQIESYLKYRPSSHLSISTIYCDDWEKGNGVSILSARDHFEDPFYLVMVDHLFAGGVWKKVLRWRMRPKENYLLVDSVPPDWIDAEEATRVLLDSHNRILKIGKQIEEYNGIDCGLFFCQPNLFEALERSVAKGRYQLSAGIQELADEGWMRARLMKRIQWFDIDTEEDYLRAQNLKFSLDF